MCYKSGLIKLKRDNIYYNIIYYVQLIKIKILLTLVTMRN